VVALKGVQSGTIFALARSTVSLKHLSEEIGAALIKGDIGIGELLREKGIETYRDILSRSYRIRMNKHPAIIVTEYFPTNIYERTR